MILQKFGFTYERLTASKKPKNRIAGRQAYILQKVSYWLVLKQ